MVAAMMMLIMLTRLHSFLVWEGGGFSLPCACYRFRGRSCTSDIWRQMRWILQGGGCEWRRSGPELTWPR